MFPGNLGQYLSIDLLTWPIRHDGAEVVALTVPHDRTKLKLSEKCRNLHSISHVSTKISMQPSVLPLVKEIVKTFCMGLSYDSK